MCKLSDICYVLRVVTHYFHEVGNVPIPITPLSTTHKRFKAVFSSFPNNLTGNISIVLKSIYFMLMSLQEKEIFANSDLNF